MILDALFERRSFENPKTSLADPAAWMSEVFGGPSDSGVPVNERTALTYSAVMAAVRVLSESIAVLPLMVFKREGKAKVRADDHPAYQLVHNQPNEEMTPATFKETTQGHAVTWGNGYAAIEFNRSGQATAMMPLLPDRTHAVRKNGRVSYRTRRNDGSQSVLSPENVLHVPGLGFDGLTGYSPIAMSRQSIGMGLAAERFNNSFFKNGAWMGGVLEHPGELGDVANERLRNSFTATQGGLANAFKPAILEEGMTWKQVGLPAKDALFLEMRKFQVAEIARIYRVPPHMLGDLDRATFSNIEQLSLEFVKYTLAIWITKWEQELTRKLIVGRDVGKFFIEFNLNAFLRGDVASRFNSFKIGRDGGWLSINDIRVTENLNPIDGGDDYLQPLNFKAIGAPDSDKTPPVDGEPKEGKRSDTPVAGESTGTGEIDRLMFAHRFTFTDASARVARRQADRVKRVSAKPKGEFEPALARILESHRVFMREAFMPPALSLSHAVAPDGCIKSRPQLHIVVEGLVDRFAHRHCEEALAQTMAAWREGRVGDIADGWAIDYPTWWPGLVDTIVSQITQQPEME